MNSEDSSNLHIASENNSDTSIDSGKPDYDSEGLAIKEEGAKEGKIYPATDAAYPLRDPSEDPTWAVRIAAIWAGITIFCIVFIIALLILGIWYD
ncbi:hypothetical protein ACFL47_04970 [Candidatus Latescibacterota bacterium]